MQNRLCTYKLITEPIFENYPSPRYFRHVPFRLPRRWIPNQISTLRVVVMKPLEHGKIAFLHHVRTFTNSSQLCRFIMENNSGLVEPSNMYTTPSRYTVLRRCSKKNIAQKGPFVYHVQTAKLMRNITVLKFQYLYQRLFVPQRPKHLTSSFSYGSSSEQRKNLISKGPSASVPPHAPPTQMFPAFDTVS